MSFAKRVAAGSTQLMLSSVATRLLSLITMPILTALLSPSAYGVAAMVATLISLAGVIALAGMDVSYVRSYQSGAYVDAEAVEAFCWRFALFSGIGIGLLVLVQWHVLAEVFELPAYLVVFVLIGIVASVANAMSLARARLGNRYGTISIAGFAAALITAVCSIAIAYYWRRDELALVVGTLLTSLIPIIWLGVPSLSKLIRSSGLSRAQRSQVFNVGIAAVLSAPAYWLMSSSDRWFLAYFNDATTVGVYAVSYTIAVMGLMVNNAVLPAWTTEAVREVESGQESGPAVLGKVAERFIAVLLVVWLAVAAAGGDIVELLAAPEFHVARVIVPFIALAVFFHGIIHIASGVFIVTNKLQKTIVWWVLAGVLCVLSNVVLIPLFGIVGAALSQVLGFGFAAVGLMLASAKVYPLQIDWRRLVLFAIVVGGCGILMSPPWSEVPLMSLLIKLLPGLAVVLIGIRLFIPNISELVRG